MNQSSPDATLQVLNLALIIANIFVYLAFALIASLLNKIAKKEVLKRRIFGGAAVILFSILAAWYMRTHFVNEQVLSGLSEFEQGEYIGRVTGLVIFPALLVLGVVGVRGWLEKRKSGAKAVA